MADDIILTQEEQEERVKKWLKENGLSIVVGACLGLGILFGVNYWRDYQVQQSENASALYTKISTAIQGNASADISADIETLKTKFKSTPYTPKAVLIYVKQLVETDLDKAADELDWVMNHADEVGVQHSARLRLARINIARNNLEQASKLLNVANYNGFDSHYHEVNGDLALQKGDSEMAKQHYTKAIETLGSDARYKEILDLKINRIEIGEQ